MKPICIIAPCEKPVKAKGMCNKHHSRLLRGQDPAVDAPPGQPTRPPIENFRKHFKLGAPDECWEWTASFATNGYGTFHIGKTKVSAHRASHIFFNGPIADGLHVLHSCDNRKCVNPSHLRAGTHQENVDDAHSKNRDAHAEGSGLAKLTSVQVADMRRRRSAGETISSLAREYGVAVSTASRAINGVLWRRLKTEHRKGEQ